MQTQDPDSPGEQLLSAAVSHPTSVGKLTRTYFVGSPDGDQGNMSESEDSSVPETMNTGISAISHKDLMKLRTTTLKISHAENLAAMFDSKAEMKEIERGSGSPEVTKYQLKAKEQRAKVRALRIEGQMNDLMSRDMEIEPAQASTPHQSSLTQKIGVEVPTGLTFGHTIASGGHTPGVSPLSHFQVVSPISPVKVEFSPPPESQHFTTETTSAPAKTASPSGTRTTSGRHVSKGGAIKGKMASRGRSPGSVLRSNASSRHSLSRSPSVRSRGTADGTESNIILELQSTMHNMMNEGLQIKRERDQVQRERNELL